MARGATTDGPGRAYMSRGSHVEISIATDSPRRPILRDHQWHDMPPIRWQLGSQINYCHRSRTKRSKTIYLNNNVTIAANTPAELDPPSIKTMSQY